MKIIAHIEKYLGPISQGWSDKSSNQELQVLYFKNSPEDGVDTFITLGLSNHVLNISSSKQVRQELVFSASNCESSANAISFLLSLCEMVINKDHRAFLRGEVVFLPYDIAEKMHFDAIYCAIPVFFDDDFSTCNETSPPTVIVCIIPIKQKEAEYVKSHGWDRFEDILEQSDIDCFDLNRESSV